ncbi:hypothetical protein MA16_Dca004325 [Dendrobium catenatum]|uniref:Uncharacterized protein n=1 Tax=Dendrobium catenatum TaxID=906689 RepID=A0A2I0W752_9ASPA|nr:hypothetical protein MA16_Dca004325 [Dendrobium catenatum]
MASSSQVFPPLPSFSGLGPPLATSYAANVSAPAFKPATFPVSFFSPSQKLSFNGNDLAEGKSLWNTALIGYSLGVETVVVAPINTPLISTPPQPVSNALEQLPPPHQPVSNSLEQPPPPPKNSTIPNLNSPTEESSSSEQIILPQSFLGPKLPLVNKFASLQMEDCLPSNSVDSFSENETSSSKVTEEPPDIRNQSNIPPKTRSHVSNGKSPNKSKPPKGKSAKKAKGLWYYRIAILEAYISILCGDSWHTDFWEFCLWLRYFFRPGKIILVIVAGFSSVQSCSFLKNIMLISWVYGFVDFHPDGCYRWRQFYNLTMMTGSDPSCAMEGCSSNLAQILCAFDVPGGSVMAFVFVLDGQPELPPPFGCFRLNLYDVWI